jgi:hypothetical protein
MKNIKQYVEQIQREKNAAYRERNQLVAALSKLFPAFLAEHEPEDKTSWDDEWRWIVYMQIPAELRGNPEKDFPHQISWHLHISDLPAAVRSSSETRRPVSLGWSHDGRKKSSPARDQTASMTNKPTQQQRVLEVFQSLRGEHDIPKEYLRRHPTGDGVSVRYFKRVLWIMEMNGRVSELRGKGYDIQSSSERDPYGFVYLRLLSVPALKQLSLSN